MACSFTKHLSYSYSENLISKISTKVENPLTGWRQRLLRHCSGCAARRYISPKPVYHLPKRRTLNVYRFNEKKRLQAGKGKKQ